VYFGDPGSLAAADSVSVETGAIANAAGKLTPIAQMQSNAVVGHTVDNHHRGFDRAAIDGNANNILLVEAFARCCVETHHRSVVPFQPKYRLGTLLQPGVVVIPSVINRRIGTEHDFDGVLIERLDRWSSATRKDSLHRRCRIGNDSVMEPFAEIRVEIA